MGMQAGGKGSTNSDINVTPLVDVCLVLLIIFMVMVPQTVPEISVRVPPNSTQPPRGNPPQPLVIGLSKSGAMTLNERRLDRSQLSAQLSQQLDARMKKVVFMDFDDDAPYGAAMEVVQLAKESGAEIVGIMKDRTRPVPQTLRG